LAIVMTILRDDLQEFILVFVKYSSGMNKSCGENKIYFISP
jgi:hypothetical protein